MPLGNPVLATIDAVGLAAIAGVPTKLFTYGKVTETDGVLQNGGWVDLAGCSGFLAEMQLSTAGAVTTGYMGTYGFQVSNDQSNIYNIYQDNNPTIVQGGYVSQVGRTGLQFGYLNDQGWRYVRPFAKNTASNTGWFLPQIRTFGVDVPRPLPNAGLLTDIPAPVVALTAGVFTAAITNQIDFKTPSGWAGVEFRINCTALTGTSFTPTFYKKDPVSGLYTSIGTGVAVSGTGMTVVKMARGLTAAAGVFNDSYFTDWGVTFAVAGFTSAAVTITAAPSL